MKRNKNHNHRELRAPGLLVLLELNNTIGGTSQSSTYCFTVQGTSASVGGANAGVGVTAPSTAPSVENAYFTAKAGETSSVSFTQNDVTSIEIVSAADLNSVPVTVEKVSAGGSAVIRAGNPGEKVAVYSYLQITAGTDNKNIEKAKINFKIPLSWFAEKYDSDKVTLYHYDSNWKPLITAKAKEDSAHAYYTAETDGFSLFAIALLKGWLKKRKLNLCRLSLGKKHQNQRFQKKLPEILAEENQYRRAGIPAEIKFGK